MRQCPVCKSETGDDPVCRVCGFDVSCDYGRFPTLGADIPRDLKARALQRANGARADAGESGRPADAPEQTKKAPVSLLSQAEIEKLIFNRGCFAVVLAFCSFCASLAVYAALVYYHEDLYATVLRICTRLDPVRPAQTMLLLILLYILVYILLMWSVKKMKPDEWVWKRQSDGKWIVLKKTRFDLGKGASGGEPEREMVSALLLLGFGWMLGLDILYLDGFSKGKWKLATRCLLCCGALRLYTQVISAYNASGAPLDEKASGTIAIVWVWLIFSYILPLVRILRLPPVFKRGGV